MLYTQISHNISRLVGIVCILAILLSSCSKNDRYLKEAEEIMIDHPDSAFTILNNIDTLSLSEKQKQRRALLHAYLCVNFKWPIDMSTADEKRALNAFDGDCSKDEVKSLILKSEVAKYYGKPVERLELLDDAEFLAF